MNNLSQILADEFHVSPSRIDSVISLIDDGCTIPFIARYRKEQHGGMDDVMLRAIDERLSYLRSLEKRRAEVRSAINELGKLNEALASAIDRASTLSEVEELYRPYRQKRRTRASAAREKGLEPLAALLLEQPAGLTDLNAAAALYVNPDLGVFSVDEAMIGASDVLAELVSDSVQARQILRKTLYDSGTLHSEQDRPEDSVYRTYYHADFRLNRLRGHQVLALNRGEKEGFLKLSVSAGSDALPAIIRLFVIPGRPAAGFVRAAVEDGCARLLFPSVVREIRSGLTDDACNGAIRSFAMNLRHLLMQPPVRGKVTLGLDPGYRNGCKLAVVDGTGKVLDTAVIYPTPPYSRVEQAQAVLTGLIRKHGVEMIAIGNGTASREAERLVAAVISGTQVQYAMVNEAGASVYSASELASEEFPEYDVNLRSAISIARRLQDPLAELVKIDPKSIGVGQYQHDMPQAQLTQALDAVVEDCVNAVGADLNAASPSLLAHISGLSKTVARNIVRYREENGPFTSRSELLNVPKLGPKAFQQCAGFLRVPESQNVLDRTGVHPESYEAALKLLSLCGYVPEDAASGRLQQLESRVQETGAAALAEQCGCGELTLQDIVRELMKPGRDVRENPVGPLLRADVMEIQDLKPGMRLSGTVRNVTDFGAFVDIGVHHDGLVHTSRMADRYIRHPSEVVSVGDIVQVVVLEVDAKKQRISLSMRTSDGSK